jgi:hypothetical protein
LKLCGTQFSSVKGAFTLGWYFPILDEQCPRWTKKDNRCVGSFYYNKSHHTARFTKKNWQFELVLGLLH